MDTDRLHAALRAFDPSIPIDRAWTPPSSWYVAPEIFAFERDAIFARQWHPVARLAELNRPGRYVSGSLAGIPWLVLRDSGGTLRAFHNVCRHKAALLLQGSGRLSTDELVCPYHGWRYRCDGRLRAAPRMAGVTHFDRAQMGLAPMAVAVLGPYVMVHAEPDATLPPDFGELLARFDATRWTELRFVKRRRYTIGANWKVIVDNYLDGGYHIPNMHPSLAEQLDLNGYETRCFESWSLQTSPGGSAPTTAGVDPEVRIGSQALYAWLYPLVMLNRYGPALDVNILVPQAVDRTEVIYDFFFHPDVIEPGDPDAAGTFVERSIRQSDITQQEDIAISEYVQAGLQSPGYDRGRYAPTVEQGEHHFHQLLATSYARALDGSTG